MPSCSICYERFTTPIALPCGHIFCKECIRRTVDSIKSCSVQHFCPTCRAPYSVLTIDPGLVPPYLRPHVLPPIRQLFFDDPTPAPTSTPAAASTSALVPTASSSELGRAAADANALRMNCATWRRRAEIHAAANTGLLAFARAAKEHALRMRAERDAARNQCLLLKRKLIELMPELAESDLDAGVSAAPASVPHAGLPVFLTQCKAPAQFYDNPADMTASHFGPPLKRRKENPACDSDSVTRAPGVAVCVSEVPAVSVSEVPAVPASDPAASAKRPIALAS